MCTINTSNICSLLNAQTNVNVISLLEYEYLLVIINVCVYMFLLFKSILCIIAFIIIHVYKYTVYAININTNSVKVKN